MADVTMKSLINSIVTALETAQTATTLGTAKIYKGLHDVPEQAFVDLYPYAMVDDGGEATEDKGSTRAQNRIFNVIIEIGVWRSNVSNSLDDILDLCAQLKTVLESETNRFADDFKWGIEITPFGFDADQHFFRGRQLRLSYIQLEDQYDKY